MFDTSRRFYVYELAYPESMGSAIFYIGKGCYDRINQHERDAKNGEQKPVCDVIRQIWEYGEQIVKRKVIEHLDKYEAYRQEKYLIQMYGLSHLVNRLPGRQIRPVQAIRHHAPGDKEQAFQVLIEQFGTDNVFEVPV